MAVGKTKMTSVVLDLNDVRLELLEGAIGQTIRSYERLFQMAQRNFLD